MQSVNIFSVDKGEGRLDVAAALGSDALAMFVYDLAPGRSSSPYHYVRGGVGAGRRRHARGAYA